MPQDTRQPTCAERIDGHKRGRLDDFAALDQLADINTTDALVSLLANNATARSLFDEITDGDFPADLALWSPQALDEMRERALQRVDEYPLGLDTVTVTRIELSTGGPADYLEVFWRLAGESEPAEVERIIYHFADWFDHAQVALGGSEFDCAERFASRIIPELSE